MGLVKLYPCFAPNGWSNYVDVTIDHTQIDADVSGHTILIQDTATLGLFPSAFWSAVKADGSDIVVTDARSGRHLHQELEYIDTTGGSEQLALHVLIPQLQSNKDFVLRIYYGNASASIASEKAAWPTSKWAAVYHMADDATHTKILDSTFNGNDGTKGGSSGTPTEVSGLIGKAQEYDTTGSQYISLGQPTSLEFTIVDEFTLIAIAELTSLSPRYGIIGRSYRYGLAQASGAKLQGIWRGGQQEVSGGWVANTPFYVGGSWDGTSATTGNSVLYVGGSAVASFSQEPAGLSISDWHVGGLTAMSGTPSYTDGKIHEARIASVALSATEHKLIYLAYLAPGTLYGVYAQQSV